MDFDKSKDDLTLKQFAEKKQMHPKVLAYVQKYSEIQKISKLGLMNYMKTSGYIKGLPYAYKFINRKFGEYISTSITLMLMLYIFITYFLFAFNNRILDLIFIICFITCAFSLILLFKQKDPGYKESKSINDSDNIISLILDQIRGDDWIDHENYCFACLIKKSHFT